MRKTFAAAVAIVLALFAMGATPTTQPETVDVAHIVANAPAEVLPTPNEKKDAVVARDPKVIAWGKANYYGKGVDVAGLKRTNMDMTVQSPSGFASRLVTVVICDQGMDAMKGIPNGVNVRMVGTITGIGITDIYNSGGKMRFTFVLSNVTFSQVP